jgi:hypothetical protein
MRINAFLNNFNFYIFFKNSQLGRKDGKSGLFLIIIYSIKLMFGIKLYRNLSQKTMQNDKT